VAVGKGRCREMKRLSSFARISSVRIFVCRVNQITMNRLGIIGAWPLRRLNINSCTTECNSLVRDLPEVVWTIDARLGSTFSYSTQHSLASHLRRALPRGPAHLRHSYEQELHLCMSLAPADSPAKDRVLYSWSLQSSFPERTDLI